MESIVRFVGKILNVIGVLGSFLGAVLAVAELLG